MSLKIDLPLKFHDHYWELAQQGTRCTEFIVTEDSIQIAFKMKTPKKLEDKTGCVACDTGINALASTSTGDQFGLELRNKIERVLRCKQGSKGQKRARRALYQYVPGYLHVNTGQGFFGNGQAKYRKELPDVTM